MSEKGWTDEQDDIAIAMWTTGDSSQTIATRIGKTRNAVIGRMNRLRCFRGIGVVTPEEHAAHKAKQMGKPLSMIPEEATEETEEVIEEAPVEASDPEPIDQVFDQFAQVPAANGIGLTPRPMRNLVDAPPEDGVRLLDATVGMCRYPLWADVSTMAIEQKRVCGGRTKGITSWCEKHYAKVFEPPRTRSR